MGEDRNEPRMHPDDLARLEHALREGSGRMPSVDVPTGLDIRLLDAMLREKIALFLTSDQINERIEKTVAERLRSIGLPIDEDHIDETAEAVRSTIKWRKRIDKVAAGIAIAVLTAIGYALLGLVGIKLPSQGGGN